MSDARAFRGFRCPAEVILRAVRWSLQFPLSSRAPRPVVTDRRASYPGALRAMKRAGKLGRFTRHRRGRWLNNRVEQDHRRIKRRTRPMLGFQSFRTARRTLAGVAALTRLAKGQGRAVPANDRPAQRAFVHQVFGLAARSKESGPDLACRQPAQQNLAEGLRPVIAAAAAPWPG